MSEPEQRRVYPPHEVQARLEVSASGLRRLAGIYERTVSPLPRDERGRVWPEEAVEALEEARAVVREQRAVSIEAALRGQDVAQGTGEAPVGGNVPNALSGRLRGTSEPVAAILEELRALRVVVEEQNRRIGELEEALRTGRELPAGEAVEAQDGPEDPAEGHDPGDPLRGTEAPAEREERGVWRRVLDWFGFGVDRP